MNDVTMLLGENAKENFQILKTSNPNYTWLHLNSFSSGHMIIESEKTIPNEILNAAAYFCLQNTKYRNLKNFSVIYCKVSNIIPTDKVGEIVFKSYKKTTRLVIR